MSPADRQIIAQKSAQLARQRLAPTFAMLAPQIALLHGSLPSYLESNLQGVLDAFDQWARDEREVTHA